MKILVFTTLYPNSVQTNHGIFVEKRLLELLRRFDVDARVIAPVPWYPRWLARRRNLPKYHEIPVREVRNGIEIEHPRYPVIPGLSWRFAPFLLHLFSRACVNRIRETFPFELIDAHFAFPDGVAASSIALEQELPCIVTARGSDINDSPNYLLPNFLIRGAFKRISKIVAVSERLKARLLQLGAEESKVEVLPNGVDSAIFKPQTSQLVDRLGVSVPYLLSVGSLRELKGHHLVIRALAEHPALARFSLVIAGTGGMKNHLENLIQELEIEERVHLIGEVSNDELPALYSEADAFVLASSNEGCPNVVLEALACGTPVVATDVGGVPDLLPKELHDFMIKTRDVHAIANSVDACIKSNVSRESIRQHAVSLSWDATCATLQELMRGEIENHSSGSKK